MRKKPTMLEETYQSMKDAAHRHGKQFDLSFDEWLPIWNRLDASWQKKRRSQNIKLGVISNG